MPPRLPLFSNMAHVTTHRRNWTRMHPAAGVSPYPWVNNASRSAQMTSVSKKTSKSNLRRYPRRYRMKLGAETSEDPAAQNPSRGTGHPGNPQWIRLVVIRKPSYCPLQPPLTLLDLAGKKEDEVERGGGGAGVGGFDGVVLTRCLDCVDFRW